MKKLLPLLLILLMTLVGCNTAEQPTDSGFDVKDVTVTAGDQSIIALKMMDASQTYHDGKWLYSDGFLEQRISEIYPDAPLITGKDLTLTKINADLLDISLFSSDARLDTFSSLDELRTALNEKSGVFLIGIRYSYKGRYITDRFETALYYYFFRVSV